MKKILLSMLTVSLITVSLVGCGSTKATAPATADQTSSSTKSTEKPKEEVKDMYSVGEEVALNNNKLIVTGIEKSNGTKYEKPKDGKEFVIVNVTISNGGTDEISYNPFDFTMQNSQGQITNETFTTVNKDTALQSGKLASGGTVTGTIVFEQTKDDAGLILKYKSNMFSKEEIKVKVS